MEEESTEPMGITTILLDIDGTLVDSVDYHALAWQEAFQYFEKDYSFEKVRSQIGKGGDQLMPVFLTKEEIEEFGKELETYRGEHFKQNYLSQLKALPASRTFIERMQQLGKKVVLASSAKGDELQSYKKIAMIDDLIEEEHEETSADDAKRSKPEPDIFEAAMEKAGDPRKEETVAIGDSPYDAIAAKKAGIHAIGVLSGGFSREDLVAAGCEEIYDDLQDLVDHLSTSILSR